MARIPFIAFLRWLIRIIEQLMAVTIHSSTEREVLEDIV
jgi:hypothetical protein